MGILTHEEAREFYDRFGRRQDWQRFYEDSATATLVRHADFGRASSVVEFGCGTGRFAKSLLEEHLPADARYVGFDLSETMVDLSRRRLESFGERAEVHLTDGSPGLDLETGCFDRFVSNYVLDLLPVEEIRAVVLEARRVLRAGGLLGLVSLTHGCTGPSRALERAWVRLHRLRPSLVGGCRPISLREFLPAPAWRVAYHDVVTSFAVPSEIVVAERMSPEAAMAAA
jgi:ubiquinone/menaquinone biosynthesis C-methylase UbiE